MRSTFSGTWAVDQCIGVNVPGESFALSYQTLANRGPSRPPAPIKMGQLIRFVNMQSPQGPIRSEFTPPVAELFDKYCLNPPECLSPLKWPKGLARPRSISGLPVIASFGIVLPLYPAKRRSHALIRSGKEGASLHGQEVERAPAHAPIALQLADISNGDQSARTMLRAC